MNLKISIIVPVYNVEEYLHRCVDSILNQTFSDFECILVDDGSTDNSGIICDEYAKKDNRIKVIHKPNGGQAEARNVGLDMASGNYIGFVDSDDWIHPQMYEILINFAEKFSSDITVCKYKKVNHEVNKYNNYDDINNLEYEFYQKETVFNEYYSKNLLYKISTVVWNKLYKKNVFVNIRFPLGIYYEDAAIALDTIEQCNNIIIINSELYFYYQRNGSTMNSNYSEKWFEGVYNNSIRGMVFFEKLDNKCQYYYSVDDYVTRFVRDYFAVCLKNPHLKIKFNPILKAFKNNIIDVLKNPITCKMKKIMLILMLLNVKLGYRIAERYFPECIYEFMRT